jgi:hypothetical protein
MGDVEISMQQLEEGEEKEETAAALKERHKMLSQMERNPQVSLLKALNIPLEVLLRYTYFPLFSNKSRPFCLVSVMVSILVSLRYFLLVFCLFLLTNGVTYVRSLLESMCMCSPVHMAAQRPMIYDFLREISALGICHYSIDSSVIRHLGSVHAHVIVVALQSHLFCNICQYPVSRLLFNGVNEQKHSFPSIISSIFMSFDLHQNMILS